MQHGQSEQDSAHHRFRSDLKAVAIVPRRTGELLVIVGLILIGAPLAGWHAVMGYSPLFLGLVCGSVGAILIVFSMIVRARYRSHHARTHAE